MKIPRALQDMSTMKTLLTGAENESRLAGDDLPGAEHLLLSAFDLPEDSARRAFLLIDADPSKFRDTIGAAHHEALRAVGVTVPDDPLLSAAPTRPAPATGPMRMNASAQQAFQAAVALAKSKSSPLLGAHIVIAICDQEHGTVARALNAAGIDRNSLADAARRVLADIH